MTWITDEVRAGASVTWPSRLEPVPHCNSQHAMRLARSEATLGQSSISGFVRKHCEFLG
jgi:hypothetical protein